MYYDLRVVRKYMSRKEVLNSTSRGTPFWLEDATGRILVDPTGGDIDTIEAVDRFDPAVGEVFSLGSAMTFQFATADERKQPLGNSVRERILPLGRQVYVVGEVSQAAGQPVIQQPSSDEHDLIISFKSREQLRDTANSAAWLYPIIAAATGVGGIALIIFGVGA